VEKSNKKARIISGTGINKLNDDTTAVPIKIKAENGSEKSYMINFVKQSKEQIQDNLIKEEITENSSNNNYLKVLEVNHQGLNPVFNKEISSYNLVVGLDVASLEITARPENKNAKVEVTGHEYLGEGTNNISITVTAENGSSRIYGITVTKTANLELTDATLQSLEVAGYEISPNFDKIF